MTTRTARVVLDLMVDKFVTNSKRAEKAQEDVAKASEEAGKKSDQSSDQQTKASEKAAAAAKKQADAVQTVGTALTAFGTATVAALGASAKAAMDWESAWAGVTKTVDGSPEQMRELEGGLRQLAKTLPSTHTEIAAVAEAAGQLGVKRKDILSFTKTMVDLGETTNLTAEEAATDIAQIANVMGTTGDEIDNFGAALVALGNDGASTEKDILSMAQRIAGAGKLVGASEADVLALSNTLASMGVRAELGGGVATRVLLKMYAAVQSGGPKLEAFAKTAGVSAQDFATAFAKSPVEALGMVTAGMERVKTEGGNVVDVMKAMGMKGTEEMQVMLSLAGAGDLLTESLELGSKAWEENTALINEASKRYETTESKVKVAWNNIKDAAIDAGAVMLPVIQGIAENVTGLAQGFGSLPAPLQGAVTGLGGVVGAAALAGGGLMLLLPKARDTIQAFKDLNTRADGSSRGLGKVGKAAGLAAAAFVGFEILKSVHNSMQTGTDSTEEWTQSLLKLAKQPDSIDKAFADIEFGTFENDVNNAGDAMKRLVDQDFNTAISSFGATVLGIDNDMAKIASSFERADIAMSGAVTSGNLELASKGFRSVAESAKLQGIEVEETAKRFPNYLNALRALSAEHNVHVDDAALLKWAMGEIPPEMEKVAGGAAKAAAGILDVKGASGQTIPISKEVAEALAEIGLSASGSILSIDKFTAALLNTGLLQLSARDASRGWSQALLDLGLQADGTGGQIGSLGTAFDNTTEQGLKNQAMFDGVAQAGIRNVTAMAQARDANGELKASNEEVQGALQGTYDGLIAAAGQFGITGDEAIALTRDVLGVPDGVDINSWMSDAAIRMAQATSGEVSALDGRTATVTLLTKKITQYEEIFGSSGKSAGLFEAQNGSEGGAVNLAGGGEIRGPGTSTSDEAGLFRLADGEHVLDAADVRKMGGQQGVYKFRRELRFGQFEGLAEGGGVGRSMPSVNIASVTRSASAPAPAEIDYQVLADALVVAAAASPIHTSLRIDKREFASAVSQANQFEGRN